MAVLYVPQADVDRRRLYEIRYTLRVRCGSLVVFFCFDTIIATSAIFVYWGT